MRGIVTVGAMIIGAIAGLGGPSRADHYHPPVHHTPYGGYPPGGCVVTGGWNGGGYHGGGYHGGGWNGGGSSHHVGGGGFVTNRPNDGRPPMYNRPNDGLPPLPARRLPNGQYLVNRPNDGVRPFVVGRPRY